MARQIDRAVAASLAEAVRTVEASSSAELVVEVRARSGSYAEARARFAALAAFIALLFVLFSPWTFAPLWVPVMVLSAYGVALFASRLSDPIQRLMTTRRERESRVRTAAAAAFYERGVANTQRESGLLIYLSMLERRMEVIADRGVLDAVPALAWNQIVEMARRRRANAATLLEVVRALEPLLVRYLAAASGDRDELSNEVLFASQ